MRCDATRNPGATESERDRQSVTSICKYQISSKKSKLSCPPFYNNQTPKIEITLNINLLFNCREFHFIKLQNTSVATRINSETRSAV